MRYSLPNMIKEYYKNKDLINAYYKNDLVQRYKYRGADNNGDMDTILGLSITIFMTILFINLIIWVIAIYMLVVNWKKLQDWAKIIGVGGMIFYLPIVTIVIVLVGKK